MVWNSLSFEPAKRILRIDVVAAHQVQVRKAEADGLVQFSDLEPGLGAAT